MKGEEQPPAKIIGRERIRNMKNNELKIATEQKELEQKTWKSKESDQKDSNRKAWKPKESEQKDSNRKAWKSKETNHEISTLEQRKVEQETGSRDSTVYDELEAERAAGVYEEDGRDFRHDQKGMGTVEIILIIVVLVGLVIIFKDQITQIVNSLFGKITQQTGGI